MCGDAPEPMIESVQEVESCKYVVTLSAPQLCPEPVGDSLENTQEVACFPYSAPESVASA